MYSTSRSNFKTESLNSINKAINTIFIHTKIVRNIHSGRVDRVANLNFFPFILFSIQLFLSRCAAPCWCFRQKFSIEYWSKKNMGDKL